jgi:hypothetical protein
VQRLVEEALDQPALASIRLARAISRPCTMTVKFYKTVESLYSHQGLWMTGNPVVTLMIP